MGHSRYGGPVVDLPENVTYPDDMQFAAQIDLRKFSPFDKSGLLPKTGQLIFFANIRKDTGKVIYADVDNSKLIRTIKEHTEDFFSGKLIDHVFADTESLAERFKYPEEDYDGCEQPNEEGMIWRDDAGREKSKIFGVYTDCQMGQKGVEEITFSNNILLLQVGENGFNDEGVFSVLIPKEDLKNKIFDNCKFNWAQT